MLQSSPRCPVSFCCSVAKICPGIQVTAASSSLVRLPHASAWRVQVAYNSSQLRLEDILESIRDAGFEADLLSSKAAEPSGKASVQYQVSQLPSKPMTYATHVHKVSHTYVYGSRHVRMPFASASFNDFSHSTVLGHGCSAAHVHLQH